MLVIGLIVALGGSLLRDVVLNQPPVVIWMNWYLVVAGAAALVVGALVVGVISAIGGGMLRDIVLSLPVTFVQVGTLYAVAAGSGVGVLVLLVSLGTPVLLAAVICVAVTTIVRIVAVVFSWTFPEQRSLPTPHRRTPRQS